MTTGLVITSRHCLLFSVWGCLLTNCLGDMGGCGSGEVNETCLFVCCAFRGPIGSWCEGWCPNVVRESGVWTGTSEVSVCAHVVVTVVVVVVLCAVTVGCLVFAEGRGGVSSDSTSSIKVSASESPAFGA